MATLASLRILLGLDSGDVTKGAGRVRGELRGVQAEANKTRDAFTGIKQGIAAGFGLGAGIGAFNLASQATREFTEFIGDSITKASALNETLSKSAVIFGQDAAAVEAWGRTAATAFGQSTGQAIEARATLGNLFKTMGLGQADVLGMSRNVVELASDLASFNNIGVDEALEKLRSGLVGQAEPLRTLGVQLTEANVKAKAMEMGLGGVNGALSESAKVQARYALILEQTGTAQGDFGRTSGALANQQKTLDANLANVSAEIGGVLTPLMTELAVTINTDVIPAIREIGVGVAAIIGPINDLRVALASVGVDLPDLIPFVGDAREMEETMRAVIVTFQEQAAAAAPLLAALEKTNQAQRELQRAFGDGIITEEEYIAGSLALAAQFERDTDAATNAAAATRVYIAAEREATAAGREAAVAIAALTADTVALTAANQAGADAMLTKRTADLDAAAAQAELKKWTDLAGDSAAEAANNLLDFASGANTGANEANAAATAARKLQAELAAIERNIEINIAYKIATAPFINPRAAPGTADANRQNAFDSGGDQDALDQATANFLERDRLAKAAAADAERFANEAASEAKRHAADGKRLAEEAARQSERDAADAQRAKEEMWRAAEEAADRYFDRVHRANLDAIDDIRDRRNAELDAANAAIQAPVNAERERLEAIRDAEREQGLRGAVATAETPEDLAAAQRDLQRFLEDERLEFMQGQADASIALNEAARENANAAADMAIAAEALRDIAARERFDPRVTMTEGGSVASVNLADFINDAPIQVNVYIDGERVTETVDRRLNTRRTNISPTSVSTGSAR